MSPEERLRLQIDIFDVRLEDEARPEFAGGFISDRTLADNLSYCVIRNFSTLTDEHFYKYRDLAFASVKSYDLVFYFPLHKWEGIDDGLRQLGHAYNTVVDSTVHDFLVKSGCNFREVPIASPEARARFVMNQVTAYKRLREQRMIDQGWVA